MKLTKWVKLALVVALVLLPIVLHTVYRKFTAFPDEITVAAGSPGARYIILGTSLAREIRNKLNVDNPKAKVHIIPTPGSLASLAFLDNGRADFALYPGGALEILRELDPDSLRGGGLPTEPSGITSVSFVASLELQPAHIVVRRGAGIETPTDLKGKTVTIGTGSSASYAMSLVLLRHFGLDTDSIRPKRVPYLKMKQAFLDGSIDAAIITTGMLGPVIPELFATGKCSFLSIPNTEALAAKYLGISQYKIPMGIYRAQPPAVPATDIQTVAFRTQLLTRTKMPARIVEEVTKIVLSEEFIKKNSLGELYVKGRQFAQNGPDFKVHLGARNVYNPELRPWLDPVLVSWLEALRSFIFSSIVATYLAIVWLRRRKQQKIDKYIESLFAIEQELLPLVACPNADEGAKLQNLLERLTILKQEEFRNFAAHEMNEDQALSCFIQMCNGLSDTINARMSRLRR